MDKVLTDFANMSAMIVEGLIKSVPEPDSPLYWLMLGSLLMLLALLMMWLLVRMRRARLAKEQCRDAGAGNDVQRRVGGSAAAAAPEAEDEAPAEREPEKPVAPQVAAEAEMANARTTAVPGGSEIIVPAPATGEGSGFRFFKRKGRPPRQRSRPATIPRMMSSCWGWSRKCWRPGSCILTG